MAARLTQNSWTTGEIDPLLYGRFDSEQYHRGAALLRNFIVKRSGALKRRPGTDLVADVAQSLSGGHRCIPFVLDRSGGYIVVFSVSGAVAYGVMGGEAVAEPVAAEQYPFTSAEYLGAIRFCQSGDTVFIANKYCPPHTLVRDADGRFSLERLSFLNNTQQPVAVAYSTYKIEQNTDPGGEPTDDNDMYARYFVSSVIDGVESLPTATEEHRYYRWLDGGYFTLDITPPPTGFVDYFKIYRADVKGAAWHQARYIGRTDGETKTTQALKPNVTSSPYHLGLYYTSMGIAPIEHPDAALRALGTGLANGVRCSENGAGAFAVAENRDGGAFLTDSLYRPIVGDNLKAEAGSLCFSLSDKPLEITFPGGVALKSVTLTLFSLVWRHLTGDGGMIPASPAFRQNDRVKQNVLVVMNKAPWAYIEAESADDPDVRASTWVELPTDDDILYKDGEFDIESIASASAANAINATTIPNHDFLNASALPSGVRTRMRREVPVGGRDILRHGGVKRLTIRFCRSRPAGSGPPSAANYATGSNNVANVSSNTNWWRPAGSTWTYNLYPSDTIGSGNSCGLVSHIALNQIDDSATYRFVDPRYTLGDEIPRSTEDPFNGVGKYPAHVSLYQQRLVFAGTLEDPNRVWFSRVGDLYEFYRSLIAPEDDPIEFALPVMRGARINHMLLGRSLFLFCGTSEWIVQPSQGLALTYQTILADNATNVGSSEEVAPILCGNDAVYVTGDGASVMCFLYGNNGYNSTEISAFAQHLFRSTRIVSWAWQQFPDSTLWCVTHDGGLLSCTYVPDQRIVAWARHDLGGGFLARAVVATDAIVGSHGEPNTSEMFLLAERPEGGFAILRFRQDAQTLGPRPIVADAVEVADGEERGHAFDSVLRTMPVSPKGGGSVSADVKNIQAAVLSGIACDAPGFTVDVAPLRDYAASAPATSPQRFALPPQETGAALFHSRATLMHANTSDGQVEIAARGAGDLEIHSVDLFATLQT